jgi:uncharacterized repeat protein (TIGR02543 family)
MTKKRAKTVIAVLIVLVIAVFFIVIIACDLPTSACSKKDAYCECVVCFCGFDYGCKNRTVKFDSQGGTNCPSKTVRGGDMIKLPATTKQGAMFKGWYTAGSGGTRVGLEGFFYTVTKNITLYAQWGDYPDTFTVDGSGPNSGGKYTYEFKNNLNYVVTIIINNESYQIPTANPVISDYNIFKYESSTSSITVQYSNSNYVGYQQLGGGRINFHIRL